MSVEMAGYKLNLSTAVFHPYESLSLFTLRASIPCSIETLCYPELVKYLTSDSHMLKTEWNDIREWLQFVLNEEQNISQIYIQSKFELNVEIKLSYSLAKIKDITK